MKLDLTIPTNITEIPLKHYQEFLKMRDNSNDEEFVAQKMIEIFCGIQLKDVVRMKLTSVNELVIHFNNIFSEKPKFKQRFKIGEIEFGFIPNLENISFGEYVDLDNYLAKWDDFHKAMAVMYRPIIRKHGDKYEIAEYTGASEFCDLMKFAPLDIAISSSIFFWTLGKELLNATLNFMEKELTKMKTEESLTLTQELSLEKNGVGIQASMDSLRETLHATTKLLNMDYLSVSPIYPSKPKRTKSK
jgi:hypothetical protein